MSHLYIECLCPSALVLTLGRLTFQSLQGSEFCSHPHRAPSPGPASCQTPELTVCGIQICRGLRCLVTKPLAGAEALSTIALAFHSAKKGTTLFPPQGETLPHDCHLLAQVLPGSGISRQLPNHPCGPLVALSGRTSKSQLHSNQSRPFSQLGSKENLVKGAARQAGSRWDPAHTSYKGPGKGWRVRAFINPVPPREHPTERTDQNPSFFRKKKKI